MQRTWRQLSLAGRLSLITVLAMTIAGAALLVVSVDQDTRIMRQEYQIRVKARAATLRSVTQEPAVVGDYATLEQLLTVQAGLADARQIVFTDPQGGRLAVDGKPMSLLAPAWFAHWIGLPAFDASETLVVGGVHYGQVTAHLTPNRAINSLWANFQRLSVIVLLTVVLVIFAIVFILRRGLTPLSALTAAAHGYAQGDTSIRLDPQGSAEFTEVTSAFNRMADSLDTLLTEAGIREHELRLEKERAVVTLRSIGDGVITTDREARITFMNPVAEALTGYSLREAVGQPLAQIFHIINEQTREPAEAPVMRVLRENRILGLANHTALIHRDGNSLSIEDSAAPIRDEDGIIVGVVLVFHDVTEARRLAHEMSHQASHDALTGLVNRIEFERRLTLALDGARSQGLHHALVYFDLDQFKVINDTCGHLAGDELLRQITAQMQEHVRASDTLARLGGDEFGLLLEDCPLTKARDIAQGVLNAVQGLRFCWDERSFIFGISAGVTSIDAHSRGVAHILSVADSACYAAKEAGRNRVHVFASDDLELARRHGEMEWVARINQALEQNRFRLYRQRIAPLSAGHGEHYEVLLRLEDESGNLVPPGAFIPAAERYGMMLNLDRWVVRHALQWLAAHPGYSGMLAINLSGQSLADEPFLAFVSDQLRLSKAPTTQVCFEITETAAVANFAKAIHFIRELRDLGCRFALDDFGSGLSSFAYLKNFPIDFIKIDGAFVRELSHDHVNVAIVRAIHQVARELGIHTIAEWVESEAIMAILRDIGVEYAQGYAIAKPEPLV